MLPPLSIIHSASDIATLFFIFGCLLFSIFSLVSVFQFHVKTLKSYLLKDFNSLWTVRTLLVSFISLWALSELLRLPILRRYPFPIFGSLTLTQQINLCKIHVVLTQGFFEPGFLVSLLFIVNISIRKRNPNDTWAMDICLLLSSCLPIFCLQVFFVFFKPKQEARFTEGFFRSYVIEDEDDGGSGTVLCTYPLLGTIIFGAFAILYIVIFLLSCWRVITLVINKGLRYRIYGLALAVLVALPTQVLLLGISVFWEPSEPAFQLIALAMFLSVLSCALVGEGVLVIKPIVDALAIDAECCSWRCDDSSREGNKDTAAI
uniref:Uncharacterized protein n=1 Tax=Nelumbo nucifera TaxID=4432 RepID=A0A822XEE2_NELNU|nr:TPA_asm: hypothetical protein HUJ06_019486 [Nelumbo nucifera]